MALLTTTMNALHRKRPRGDVPSRGWKHIPALVILLVLLIAVPRLAKAQSGTEYQIKAAFLYNFAKFVDWPSSAFNGDADPFKICVLGDSPFGSDLERTISARKVQSHPVHVIYPESVSQSRNCHILFVSSSESAHIKKIVSDLGATSVLTVADTPAFTSHGGIIGFILENERVCFEINAQAATRARLKVSSRLMMVSKNALWPKNSP